jgi:hypothetical protein
LHCTRQELFVGRHSEIPANDSADPAAENSGQPGPGTQDDGARSSPERAANATAYNPITPVKMIPMTPNAASAITVAIIAPSAPRTANPDAEEIFAGWNLSSFDSFMAITSVSLGG